MTEQLSLSGTTVTLFGDRDVLDKALSDKLGRRGCNTHTISVPTGWVPSATYAVMRLDTPAGEAALQQLLEVDHPRAHVVALCLRGDDESSDRVDALCRKCGDHHAVSLLWHGALTLPFVDAEVVVDALPPDELASAVADELAVQRPHDVAAFASRTVSAGHA